MRLGYRSHHPLLASPPQEELVSREATHAAAVEERSALKKDLQRLLRERGALDSLRTLVAGALTKQ